MCGVLKLMEVPQLISQFAVVEDDVITEANITTKI